MSRDFKDAHMVQNVPEEYEIVKTTKCTCGGNYQVLIQSLVENKGKYYDILQCKCKKCDDQREFIFDINVFFGKTFV